MWQEEEEEEEQQRIWLRVVAISPHYLQYCYGGHTMGNERAWWLDEWAIRLRCGAVAAA